MTDSNSPKRKTLGIKPPEGTAPRKPSGNRPVRVSDLNRKRVQAVAEGIRRSQGGAGAMEMPNYRESLAKFDMEPYYMNSAQYAQFAADTVKKEKAIIEKLGLAKQ
ncbi:hypothetical protein AWV80_32505 [Cupriavidus sp. UYMU48A]|nr:hypothetical protein AWV80_32505 [Cupriavidus sp. UYMU48A]